MLVQYATAKAGVILVNINPAYRTSELAYALNQSGCRMLIAAPAFKTSNYEAMIEEVRRRSPGAGDRSSCSAPTGWDALVAGAASVSDEALRERMAGLQFDDPINIQYTSGTTGFPKGATLSHHNILNNGYFIGEACRYTEADRVCIPVPFYHCFGMVLGNLACTTHGAAIVIPEAGFEPGPTLEAVAAERCTSLYGVPTMFIAELDHPDFESFDLSSLRTGIMAGSPCPVEVMKQVVSRMHMDEVTIAYGMTETSPVSTQTVPEDSLEHRVSSGRAGAPPRRGEDRRPRHRPRRRAGHAGRAVHPGLLGDDRLLERPGAHRRGDRRRRVDAHRRPGHDGRRRLRQHRRAASRT